MEDVASMAWVFLLEEVMDIFMVELNSVKEHLIKMIKQKLRIGFITGGEMKCEPKLFEKSAD